jgi:hypothetical protein
MIDNLQRVPEVGATIGIGESPELPPREAAQ